MSIIIYKLGDEAAGATHAYIRHGKHELEALVHGSKASLAKLVNQECMVEMAFERVAKWHELSEFEDEQSCIARSTEVLGAVVIRGRVHSTTEIGDNVYIVDLYLQTGPEFLAISSEELEGIVPAVHTGVEVTVYGLCFYPMKT